ncbi:hypothetical protein K2173_019070 [Erythroxylum novogranatense]|uniref:Uncharacterized protein n=1 Tax=Erythroxylum novogranatense TaxID=1862640 RepID=A0AAV8SSJ1_9ROSI|nr:hypothetical protein K2173_019070 [Erythroxylum novogranatense]
MLSLHQFLLNDGLKGAIVSVMRAFLRAFTNYFQTSAFAEINYPHYAGIEKEPGENFGGRSEAEEAVHYMPV